MREERFIYPLRGSYDDPKTSLNQHQSFSGEILPNFEEKEKLLLAVDRRREMEGRGLAAVRLSSHHTDLSGRENEECWLEVEGHPLTM